MTRVTVGGRTIASNRVTIAANATTRTNIMTNPSFESAAAWTVGQTGTVTNTSVTLNSPDMALFGTHSAKLVEGNGSAGHMYLHVTSIPITPGATYSASFYVYLTNYTSGGISLIIDDNAFNRIFTGPSTTTASQWVRLAGTFTVPITGTPDGNNKIQFIIDTGGVPLFTAYVDAAMLEVSPGVGSYFDGSFGGASWTSTPNGSTSVMQQPRLTAPIRNLA